MEIVSQKQIELIMKLNKQADKKNPAFIGMTYERADNIIKYLIKEVNGNGKVVDTPQLKDYPIAFQAFVKSACELYKNRKKKTFKEVLEEVKNVY